MFRQILSRSQSSSEPAERFIQEVFWRGYFKGWLENRPGVWHDFCRDLEILQCNIDADKTMRNRYEAAISGKTRIDCFDHWARELVQTNYLHNHARMWFASIWIFTLKLPWQLGAGFFLRYLLDGDPAANTLSWRWVGGLHTKGKTYSARAENINQFSNGRFNPIGKLAQTAPALIENAEYLLSPLPTQTPWPQTNRYGLLITEEDLHPESLCLETPPSAVAVLPAASGSAVTLSEYVLAFRRGHLDDAHRRANIHFSCPVQTLSDQTSKALLQWVQSGRIDTIIMSMPPVGPARDWLSAVRRKPSASALQFHTILRGYDVRLWPHTAAGFFKVKKKIPRLLNSINSAKGQQLEFSQKI